MRTLVACLLVVLVAAEQKREAGYPNRLAHGVASRRYHNPSSAYHYRPRTSYYHSPGYGHSGTTYGHRHAHYLSPYHHLQKREADPGYGRPSYYSGRPYIAAPQGYHTSAHHSTVPFTPYVHGGTRYGYQTSVHHPRHGYSYQTHQAYVPVHHQRQGHH